MTSPSTSLRNYSPNSNALVSALAATPGVVALSHRLQGVAQTLTGLTTGYWAIAATSAWDSARL